MKIAVSGKGGVGKTTLSAMLAVTLSLKGRGVVAIDADPDANLASALGVPPAEHPTPFSEMHELAEERTGAAGPGGYFKLNPKVDDLPETHATHIGSIRLLALGGVNEGGGGCICPATALVKALLTHLILGRDEDVVMDMEAGIEHLGRATAQSMDAMIIVINESPWSIHTALRIRKLAGDLGMTKLFAVANCVRPSSNMEQVRKELNGIPLIGCIPHDQRLESGVVQSYGPDALEASPAMSEYTDTVARIISQLQGAL